MVKSPISRLKDPHEVRRRSLEFASVVRRRSSLWKGANKGFDDEDVLEYKQVFEYFDKAKKGYIFPRQMATTLRALKPSPDESIIEAKMKEVKRELRGKINFQNFLDVLHDIIRNAKKQKRRRSCYTNLSEKQLNEIQDAFNMFDQDGDGTLTVTELTSVMVNLGVSSTEDEVKEMVNAIDEDQSGMLEFPEFVRLMTRKHSEAEFTNELLEAFRYFDKNGDGLISASEVRAVMDALGEDLSDTDIEEMIKEADKSGTGNVSYEDFCKMFSSKV